MRVVTPHEKRHPVSQLSRKRHADMVKGKQGAFKQCTKAKGSDRRCRGQPTNCECPQPSQSATHSLGRSFFTSQKGCGCGKSGLAQPASSRNYSEEHACILQYVARRAIPGNQRGMIRGSGPRVLWLRHCKPLDLGCETAPVRISLQSWGDRQHQHLPTVLGYTLPWWQVTRPSYATSTVCSMGP